MANNSLTQQSYLQKRKRHKDTVNLFRFLILIGFFILWEVTTRVGILDDFIFSSPSRVASTFGSMVKDRSIFRHVGVTLYETLLSFILVVIVGICTAVLLWLSRKLAEILEPYLVVLNSLPKSALAPLLIVWLGATTRTIIVAGMSVAIFGTIISLYTCFQEVDSDKVKLVYTLGGTKKHVLFKVVLPSTIPMILSTMKVNIGLCLVGVIIGEFISSKQGLGYLIIYGSQVFKLDWVIMSIIILCVIASGLYLLINWVEKRVCERKFMK
jgi:ABC-type nitrate/sulfonate/bicarbonate transport system, permease component